MLFDDEKNLYSFQYTLLSLTIGIIHLYSPMIAFTDYKEGTHHYLQAPTTHGSAITITPEEASFKSVASAKKENEGFAFDITHKDFHLVLSAKYGKGAFWHCNDGKLQMGISGEKETTLYYSYTNLPTEGYVEKAGKKIHLTGKTWFDKQDGTYNLQNPKTNWEWFSLRFFDNEEIMLFTFNDKAYNDGTYITRDRQRSRLNHYQIERTGTTTFNKMKWSNGWKLSLGVKEKEYSLVPVQEGHMNFAYFEELCIIKNKAGETAGYCFAELLPGILNESGKDFDTANLFKRIEF